MERQIEAIRVFPVPHGPQAVGQPRRIAVLATGADLGAAGQRIPGGFRPFDG